MITSKTETKVNEQEGSFANLILNIQKYAVAGQMVSDITHELNNIIGAMLGFAQIAKMTNNENDIKKCFEVIISCSEKAKQMNNNMLSYLQTSSNDKRDVDINTVISQSICITAKGFDRKGIKINFEPKSIPIIKLKQGLFQHALLDLFLNVKKNISPGKELKISTDYNKNDRCIEVILRNGNSLADCKSCFEHLESFQEIFNSISNPNVTEKDIEFGIACWIVKKEIGGDILSDTTEKGTGYKIKIPV